jgi:hypothetical protein
MAVVAAGAGKTPRLQLAAGVVAAGTLLVKQPLLRWVATVDSRHRPDRVSTFKASPGQSAQVTVTTGTLAVAAVAARQMLPLRPPAAARCSVAAVAARVVEQAQFLRQPARRPAAVLARLLAVGARRASQRAHQARHLYPAMRAGQPTAQRVARVAAAVARLCRLPSTAQRAARAGLVVAVAVVVVAVAIRVLVVRAALVARATAS